MNFPRELLLSLLILASPIQGRESLSSPDVRIRLLSPEHDHEFSRFQRVVQPRILDEVDVASNSTKQDKEEKKSTKEPKSKSPSKAPIEKKSKSPSKAPSFKVNETKSKSPSATTSKAPSQKTSKAPSQKTSKAPSATSSKAPSATSSKAPSQKTSKAPSATSSKAPSQKTSKAPSQKTSKAPSQKTSKAPSQKTSKAPSQKTSKAPSQKTSKAPSQKGSTGDSPSPPVTSPPVTSPPVTSPPVTSPTLIPTLAITDAKSLSCQALENGEVFKTELELEVKYNYEIYILSPNPDDDAANAELLEKNQGLLREEMDKVIGAKLLGCDISRNRRLEHQDVRRHLIIDGVDMASEPHTIFNPFNDEFGCAQNLVTTKCTVMGASFKLYLNDNTPKPYDDEGVKALDAIRSAMEGDELIVGEIYKLNYLGITAPIDVKETPIGPRPPETGDTNSLVSGPEFVENEAEKPISAMGIALIAMAAVGTAIVGAVAVRKRRDTRLKSHEIFQEDEASIFTKHSKASGYPGAYDFREDDQQTVAMSATSSSDWRKTRSAHIYGEDDSVISKTSRGIINDLKKIEQLEKKGDIYEDEFDSHDLVDVHHCTSLTCEICAAKNGTPQFIPSSYFGNSKEEVPTANLLGQREYRSDDTVLL